MSLRNASDSRIMGAESLLLTGQDLTLDNVVRVARFSESQGFSLVSLDPLARENLVIVREYIDKNWLRADAPIIYGFNSGVGKLKDTRIAPEENDLFQRLMIESHCSGIGDPASEEVVRATMLMRANSLAKGVSGVRVQVVERLLEMLNCGVHPVVPLLVSAAKAHIVSIFFPEHQRIVRSRIGLTH